MVSRIETKVGIRGSARCSPAFPGRGDAVAGTLGDEPARGRPRVPMYRHWQCEFLCKVCLPDRW